MWPANLSKSVQDDSPGFTTAKYEGRSGRDWNEHGWKMLTTCEHGHYTTTDFFTKCCSGNGMRKDILEYENGPRRNLFRLHYITPNWVTHSSNMNSIEKFLHPHDQTVSYQWQLFSQCTRTKIDEWREREVSNYIQKIYTLFVRWIRPTYPYPVTDFSDLHRFSFEHCILNRHIHHEYVVPSFTWTFSQVFTKRCSHVDRFSVMTELRKPDGKQLKLISAAFYPSVKCPTKLALILHPGIYLSGALHSPDKPIPYTIAVFTCQMSILTLNQCLTNGEAYFVSDTLHSFTSFGELKTGERDCFNRT